MEWGYTQAKASRCLNDRLVTGEIQSRTMRDCRFAGEAGPSSCAVPSARCAASRLEMDSWIGFTVAVFPG